MLAYKKNNGFTLMEVMIVVIIIGITASIALPAYRDSVRKANRREVQAYMTEFAQFMERNYSEAFLYHQDTAGATIDKDSYSASSSINKNYTILLTPTSTSYTLQATPKAPQASDSCGTLTLAEDGTYTPAADCW